MIQHNFKRNRYFTLEQEAFYAVMSTLNFDMCHVHLTTVLTDITAFKVELTFLKMPKITKKWLIKQILTTATGLSISTQFIKLN